MLQPIDNAAVAAALDAFWDTIHPTDEVAGCGQTLDRKIRFGDLRQRVQMLRKLLPSSVEFIDGEVYPYHKALYDHLWLAETYLAERAHQPDDATIPPGDEIVFEEPTTWLCREFSLLARGDAAAAPFATADERPAPQPPEPVKEPWYRFFTKPWPIVAAIIGATITAIVAITLFILSTK